MSVLGIDEIIYGATTWRLPPASSSTGAWPGRRAPTAGVRMPERLPRGGGRHGHGLPPAIEDGPTLREVVWGVESEADLARCADAICGDAGFVDAVVDGRAASAAPTPTAWPCACRSAASARSVSIAPP
jgi:hypothetical protein